MSVVVSTPNFEAQINRKLDKTDFKVKGIGLAYLEHCQFEGIVWNTIKSRMLAAVPFLELAKDPESLEKSDVMRYVNSIKSTSVNTQKLRKDSLKKFLEFKERDDLIEFLKGSRTKRRKKRLPVDNLLLPKDIKCMLRFCRCQRDRALLMLFWDSAARLGEVRALNIKNVEFDEYGGVIYLPKAEGLKTGQRRIRLIDSAPDLLSWINQHPLREDPGAPVFVALHPDKGENRETKKKFRRMSDGRVFHIIKQLGRDADIKKDVSPHKIRHARLTFLAKKGFNESELRIFAGWTDDSEMPAIYLHMSGKDVERKSLEIAGIKVEGQEERDKGLEPKECPRCLRKNPHDALFCNCGLVLDEKMSIELEKTKEGLVRVENIGFMKSLLAPDKIRELLGDDEVKAIMKEIMSDELRAGARRLIKEGKISF